MELFAADGHDAGGCERVTGKSGMRPLVHGVALTTAELSAGLAMPVRWMRAPSGLTRQSCGEPASARACSSSRATKWRRHLHAEDVARRSAAPVNRKRTRAATRRSVADQEQPVPEGDRIRRPRTRGDRPAGVGAWQWRRPGPPARAGMHPGLQRDPRVRVRLPRTRGDRPGTPRLRPRLRRTAPRAGG